MALSIAASPYLGTARSLAKTEGRSRVGCVRDPRTRRDLSRAGIESKPRALEKSPNPRALSCSISTWSARAISSSARVDEASAVPGEG